jgi:hypothetical protein
MLQGDLTGIGLNEMNAFFEALHGQGVRTQELRSIRLRQPASELVALLLHLWTDEPPRPWINTAPPAVFGLGSHGWDKICVTPSSEHEQSQYFPWDRYFANRQDVLEPKKAMKSTHLEIYIPENIGNGRGKPLTPSTLHNYFCYLPDRVRNSEVRKIVEELKLFMSFASEEEKNTSPKPGWHLLRYAQAGELKVKIASSPAYITPDFVTHFFLCLCLRHRAFFPKNRDGGQAVIRTRKEGVAFVITSQNHGWDCKLLTISSKAPLTDPASELIDIGDRLRPARNAGEFAERIAELGALDS